MTENKDRFNLGIITGIVIVTALFVFLFAVSKVSNGEQKCEIGDRVQIVNTNIIGTVIDYRTSSFIRYYKILVDFEDKTVSLTIIEVEEKDIIKIGKLVTPTTKENK